MTTPATTVVKTITAAEIRDVTHHCHWIAARSTKRDSHFSGFAPRTSLAHVDFLSNGTLQVVMVKKRKLQLVRASATSLPRYVTSA